MNNEMMPGQSRRLVSAFRAGRLRGHRRSAGLEWRWRKRIDTRQVETAVTALKDAMLSGDGAKLKALTLDQLTYGHSNARLEDKAAFVASLDGKNAFKSIDLSGPDGADLWGRGRGAPHLRCGEQSAGGNGIRPHRAHQGASGLEEGRRRLEAAGPAGRAPAGVTGKR